MKSNNPGVSCEDILAMLKGIGNVDDVVAILCGNSGEAEMRRSGEMPSLTYTFGPSGAQFSATSPSGPSPAPTCSGNCGGCQSGDGDDGDDFDESDPFGLDATNSGLTVSASGASAEDFIMDIRAAVNDLIREYQSMDETFQANLSLNLAVSTLH